METTRDILAPASEPESRTVFSCSGRCPEPLESAREAPEIEFGGLNNLLSFPLRTATLLLEKILGQSGSGRQIRSPGPPELIPAALGISQSRKTRWVTQSLTREPVFTRRFDIFTEQPPVLTALNPLARARFLHCHTAPLSPRYESAPSGCHWEC